jgi:hypothetical protein
MLLKVSKSVDFRKVPGPNPLVLLLRVVLRRIMSMEWWWVDSDVGNPHFLGAKPGPESVFLLKI